MKTERLYYSDSFIKKFDAIVVSCEKLEKGYKVVLDKTASFLKVAVRRLIPALSVRLK